MKCNTCNDEVFTTNFPVGIYLPKDDATLHKCSNGKNYRLVGLRSAQWYVIEEEKHVDA